VRFVLAPVISVVHRPRLLSYAERCMARMPRELVVESEDLLEMVLVLPLAGKPKWRGSLDRLQSSLCRAMWNMSLHPHRSAEKVAALELGRIGMAVDERRSGSGRMQSLAPV
jgi:hypothetical protein